MMMQRTVCFAGLLALVLSACGLKPGVHVTAQGGFVPGNPSIGASLPGQPLPAESSSGTGALNGVQPTAGAGTAGQAAQQPAGPADRTGITATTITIGVHAPITGSAPISAGA